MKTLLVKPGAEIVEKTLRGPWPPELAHLENVYKDPRVISRGIVSFESFCPASALAVGSKLKTIGEDVEYLHSSLEFGLPLTDDLNKKRYEQIAAYIGKGRYDIVGISCTSTMECVATQTIAHAAKRAAEDITVLVGGYQATAEGVDLLKKIPAVDVVVLSDFEPVAEQLYRSFHGDLPMKTIPNLIYRDNDLIHTTERKYFKLKPEDLPVYDYSLVKKYVPYFSYFLLEASRGCPYQCSFCQEKVLRHSFVLKEADTAVTELIESASYLGQIVDQVVMGYSDPLWGSNAKWVKEFCSSLIERDEEPPMWNITARVNQFDRETLALMKKAGCLSIGYGVESLSSRMLTMANKTRDPHAYCASVFDTVERTVKAHIQAVLFLVLGLPGETRSTIEETLTAIKKLPVENANLHLQFALSFPLRGTDLDAQLSDPAFAAKYGVKVIAEGAWEKAYLPWFTQLFNPSKELTASDVTDIFLDITSKKGIPASLEKQHEKFEKVKKVLDKEYISPEELAAYGKIMRKVVVGVS